MLDTRGGLINHSRTKLMPILAFADSIRILVWAFIFFGSAIVIGYAIYRLIRFKRISGCLGVVALLAAVPLTLMIIAGAIEGDIEWNPWITSKEQLVGRYSEGDHVIQLNADGTYTSSGFAEIASGTWSNFDWNLTLSNTRLKEARVIVRNGVFCIAPFYAGVDSPVGILLKKNGS